MKLVFFSAYYHPHVGGYIVNVRTLAEALVAKGHDVFVVTCDTDTARLVETLGGVHIVRLPCWHLLGGTYPVPKPSKWLWRLLMGWFVRKPDIVSTQTRFFPTSALGWLLGRLWRAKVVHTERGTQHSASLSPLVDLISKVYDHTVGAVVIRCADARTGVSQAACDFSRHLSGRTAQRIPNGINREVFDGDHSPPDTPRVIFVGRLIQAKGVQDLIDAMVLIRREHQGTELVIVGDGPYRATLENRAIGLPVRFAGELSHEQVAEELRGATVFVNPSYSEGLPTSVMEAAAMGLPIVATDVGGTREIILRGGAHGLLMRGFGSVGIAINVCCFLSDPPLALKYGRNARRLVTKRFGWGRIVETYESLFAALLKRP